MGCLFIPASLVLAPDEQGLLCATCDAEPSDGGELLCYEILPPASCTVFGRPYGNDGRPALGWCFSCSLIGSEPEQLDSFILEDAGAAIIVVSTTPCQGQGSPCSISNSCCPGLECNPVADGGQVCE